MDTIEKIKLRICVYTCGTMRKIEYEAASNGAIESTIFDNLSLFEDEDNSGKSLIKKEKQTLSKDEINSFFNAILSLLKKEITIIPLLETKSILTIYYSTKGHKEILEDSNINECVEAFLQTKFSLNN